MSRLPLSLPANELRALFITWSACMVALAGTAVFGTAGFPQVGLFVCALGSLALGTQLFGQEFGNRTLALLLSQPAARDPCCW
jgi:ABC-type transport system involved in multi-copper enzyme maturation permease subunit